MTFHKFFQDATKGRSPYPYQESLANAEQLPELLSIPTGLGKTAAIVLGWIYRRRFHDSDEVRTSTPRRLVYCFPMRVLVEQTVAAVEGWLEHLGLSDQIKVSQLMGGIDPQECDWDERPEHDAILVGTQDMLLSRALNRGYGMSRYRWPMHFGLLNNDSLWVMDETQLMGVGLTTTAQLQGLRQKLTTYGASKSLWMSATLDTSPINTVDHREPTAGFSKQELTEDDLQQDAVKRRVQASKPLEMAKIVLSGESEKKGYAKDLATAIKSRHEQHSNSLTLVVLNRVARAQDVYNALEAMCKKSKSVIELALVHSRFRPHDRRIQEQRLFDEKTPDAGRIVIATQAIEAGVDVSAHTLFSELAPWPSMVQRFGRCNRKGDISDAQVIWIDTQSKDDKDKVLLPYASSELDQSRKFLKQLVNVGPEALESTQRAFQETCEPSVVHTLRKKDLLDLWDTTPDLAGNDLDVSRFIRDSDDTDVQFYWREFQDEIPDSPLNAARREELCSVAIGRAREFLAKIKKNKSQTACLWNPLDAVWKKVESDDVRPGMVLLLKPEMGGYLDTIGWTGDATNKPSIIPDTPTDPKDSKMDGEPLSQSTAWVSLKKHLQDVAKEVQVLQDSKNAWDGRIPWSALMTAAWWHDVGKSHPAFQYMLLRTNRAMAGSGHTIWAKSARKQGDIESYQRAEYAVEGPAGLERRIGFRHELASALAWLQHQGDHVDADLIAYLIAAHHGKVRGSIRSLPNELAPADPKRKFARGIWDGDQLPAVELGNGETAPATVINLSLMQLGQTDSGASWLGRVLALRDAKKDDDRNGYGPFRLSFLETLIRIADWRGTKAGGQIDAE